MKLDLLGQHGVSESVAISDELTQNWYIHVEQTGKAQISLLPTPGLAAFAVTSTGPIRGMIEYNSLLYVVSADTLWEIDSSGSTTNRGTLNTSTGRVGMEHNGPANGQQLVVVDGTNAYIYDSANTTFYQADDIATGNADTNIANALVDTSVNFSTLGAAVGQRVFNTDDGTTAVVASITTTTNPNDTLTLEDDDGVASDIFPAGTEAYAVGDPDFPSGATQVEFIDSRFIVNDPATTGRFYISDSYDGRSWPALGFATAERNPDDLQAIKVSNRIVWMLGTTTAEAWWFSGADDVVPLEPVQSGFSEWGTPAPWSVAEMAGSIFYLAQNTEGTGQVVMTNGLNPTVISTTAITTEITSLTTLSDAYGYCYQYNGHNFYVLSFPTDGHTFVYDITTQMWHKWNSAATNGQHRSTHHVFIYDKHLVGDSETGRVFELDWDTYTDFGDTITRIRRSRSIHGEDRALRHRALWLDMEEGVGDFTTTDPQIMMRFRDDAGLWSNEKWRSIGAMGKYRTRVVWRMLGRSRDRVYEFKITDPVKAVVIAAYADVDADEEEIR